MAAGYDPDLILSDFWNMFVGSDAPAAVDAASHLVGDVYPQTLADIGAMIAPMLFGL